MAANCGMEIAKLYCGGPIVHSKVVAVALVVLMAEIAVATPFWVSYEANDFPENEGWTRIIDGDGPAVRTLHDGVLTIDGRRSTQISDSYRMERPLNPGPGEQFVVQWRLRVDEVIGNPNYLYDPGLGFASDDFWDLDFHFGVNQLRSVHEDVVISFEPGVFHSFEVRSPDMRTYELQIDGSLVYTGELSMFAIAHSRITWGDFTRGSASLADWDYFRFGVVPEPETATLLLALVCIAQALRLTRRIL